MSGSFSIHYNNDLNEIKVPLEWFNVENEYKIMRM